MSHDPGQGFMDAAAAEVMSSPVETAVSFCTVWLIADTALLMRGLAACRPPAIHTCMQLWYLVIPYLPSCWQPF